MWPYTNRSVLHASSHVRGLTTEFKRTHMGIAYRVNMKVRPQMRQSYFRLMVKLIHSGVNASDT